MLLPVVIAKALEIATTLGSNLPFKAAASSAGKYGTGIKMIMLDMKLIRITPRYPNCSLKGKNWLT
jgi:hypothetical protein